MTRRKILATALLAVTAALGAAGCQPSASVPPQVPASFTPSPCPSGQHLGPLGGPDGDGCLDGASHPEYGGQS